MIPRHIYLDLRSENYSHASVMGATKLILQYIPEPDDYAWYKLFEILRNAPIGKGKEVLEEVLKSMAEGGIK